MFYFTDLSIVTLARLEEEDYDANPRLFCLQEYNCDRCNFVLTLKVDIKQHILPIHEDFRYNRDPLCNLLCIFNSMACENGLSHDL